MFVRFLLIVILTLFRITYSLNKETFPDNFIFGIGSSSFQIEGAWNEDGKSESIWDYWTHTKEAFILDLSNADVSSDSYHKTEEDVALLSYLGVDFYRFSISWPRVLPTGLANKVNEKGVQYYKNLLEKLKSRGIAPMVVLYNWDIPKRLEVIGGWTNHVMVDYFFEYGKVVIDRFGSLVDFWLTFHDPVSICSQEEWVSGMEEYVCMHNVLKAHAKTYYYYKENTDFKGQMSININANWYKPKTTTDQEAVERLNQFMVGWIANPIFSQAGDYPQIMKERIQVNDEKLNLTKSRLPTFSVDEINQIKNTADFFAVSHFTSYVAAEDKNGVNELPSVMADAGVLITMDDNAQFGASDWLSVNPDGLRNVLNWIQDTYNSSKIFVTGNGYSDNGEIDDNERINYHQDYLSALLDAIYTDGIRVEAYSAWSFLDSFEWTEGYSHRFGLVHVDFTEANRTKTVKASGDIYKKILENRKL